MADEITALFQISIKNGELSIPMQKQFTADQAGTKADSLTLAVTDTAANISFGSLTTPGIAMLHNIGSNEILIGKDVAASFEEFLEILPGESYPVRIPSGVTLQAKCNTGETSSLYAQAAEV